MSEKSPTTKNSTTKIRKMKTKILSKAFFLLLSVALVPYSNACVDLEPYATNPGDLSILKGGDQVPDDAPVFFHVPAQFISEEIVYCLENVTIPTFVGGNNCKDSQKCWLAVGIHAAESNIPSATESCVNSDGDTSGCYDCICQGSSMRTGLVEDTGPNFDGCGLSTDTRWGVTCGDVTNERYDWVGNERVASNFSHVQVPICEENRKSYCNFCQGGFHPAFQVGIQWISDLEEQCVNNPFGTYSCSEVISISSLIAVIAGSVLFLGAVLSLYFYSTQRRKNRNSPETSAKGKVQINDPSSPPVKKLSIDTETSA